ncbi:hypothetical protein N9E84_03840, partial [Planktomarina temperata]|nr:hypothetical protein [Planktomarina temperata]
MRITFSSKNCLSYFASAVFAFLAPCFVMYPSPAAALYESGRAFEPADCTEPVVFTAIALTFNTVKTAEDADHEDQLTFEYGAAGAVCELLFGASVWSQHRNPVIQAGANILRSNDGYKALLSADKKTQQALVKDSLQKWFNMDAEGISAAMAQLAAQEKKQEEKDNDAAEEAPVEETPVEEAPVEEAPVEETPVEEAPAEETPVEEAPVEEAKRKKAADDAFAVFDMTAEEARAAIKRAAADAVNKQLKNGGNIDTKQLNTQTYVDENGNKGTLWCNPGPCTLGSATKHGFVAGVGTLIPFKLVEDVTKTLGEPLTKEIFNKTKDALLASAGTSDDPKLKSAAAMTTAQIKSNQVAFEKSQEDKGGSLVVETPAAEAPAEEA